ncbi:type VI secretion system-associated FHA domain protein [Ideonella sp. DXS22W]|uniref:Type VI secretion system-associated FHA domain protein n=1 Tax=Pseudaquabacterium inlustre TaxID=2984192 RepID=A0ABU9CAW0_9BURK
MVSLKILRGAELAPGVHAEVNWPDGQPRFVIGRDPAAHWPIPDSTLALSGRHCELVATPRGVLLRDLSTNGTFVNDEADRLRSDRLLRHGDRIRLGPYHVRLNLPPAASAEAVREALAEGLGLPASALAGHDALQLTLRVAGLAQAAVASLHHLLAQQARVRTRIGAGPAEVLAGEPNPLRLAGDSAQALYALLSQTDPGAAVAQAAGDLLQHQERLLDALDTATERMGRTLAPQAFERAIGSASTADAARCWALYLEIWQRMGLPAGQPWAEGFAEALARHLALAYEAPRS